MMDYFHLLKATDFYLASNGGSRCAFAMVDLTNTFPTLNDSERKFIYNLPVKANRGNANRFVKQYIDSAY